jgi:hypothetical protein
MTLLDIDSCVSRVYTTYYPQHTACTFYMSDSEMEPRYTIPSMKNRIRKVFDFEIPMPNIPGANVGDPVNLVIKVKHILFYSCHIKKKLK